MSSSSMDDSAPQDDRLEAGKQDHNDQEDVDEKTKLNWMTWIQERFNWSWFTCTQSTGGIAVVISECPKQFNGIQTIGTIVFIFNLVLYLTFMVLMLVRWISKPAKIKESFTAVPECFFFGTFWLSFATNLICIQEYGVSNSGPWLVVAIRVIFWFYAAATLLSSSIHIVVIAKHTPIKAIELNPAVFLLIFNTMLTGSISASIAASQPPYQRFPIIVAGIAFQGLGWLVSLGFLGWYLAHLMETGWPAPAQRPGLFMPIGAAGYTIVALIGNARSIPASYGYFARHPMAQEVLRIVATWSSIFMWVFALWLFGVALFVNLAEVVVRKDGKWQRPMGFSNTWWSFIFPNVGFTLATIYINKELESNAIAWVATTMILLLVATWLFDFFLMIKSIIASLFIDSRIKLS